MAGNENLNELRRIKNSYRNFIRDNFETEAADCGTCATFGACCVDAHFVNVHITNLESAAIRDAIDELPDKETIYERIAAAVEIFDLKATGDTFAQTFACPLFEPRKGCLIHEIGKPVACISHACYENKEDLPPVCLQSNVEFKIENLNREVYGDDFKWLPLPLALLSGANIKKG